jgi:Tfp pilus assembly protein PilZ
MDEKRKHQRVQFCFQIKDKNGKKIWMTDDISVGGCFLQAVEDLPIGSKIDLVFELPGSSHYIEATGEVKHSKEGGMGIEFLNIENTAKDEVEGFVQDLS